MTLSNAGKDVKKLVHSSTAGGNIKQYRCSGKQVGNFFKN